MLVHQYLSVEAVRDDLCMPLFHQSGIHLCGYVIVLHGRNLIPRKEGEGLFLGDIMDQHLIEKFWNRAIHGKTFRPLLVKYQTKYLFLETSRIFGAVALRCSFIQERMIV